MLLRFRASNYRSIRDTVELNFRQRRGRSRESLTSIAALYGANASGKSNVLSALFSMRSAVLDSYSSWRPSQRPPREPFLLDAGGPGQPSLFEVDVVVGGIRYQYGFTVGSESFEDEWLYGYPEGRRRTMFERDAQEYLFGREFRGQNRTISDLVRPNSLFLSTAASNNHEGVMPLYEWFRSTVFSGLRSGAPGLHQITEEMLNSDERSRIEALLAKADLGICGVAIREEELDPEITTLVQEFFRSVAKRTGEEGAEPDIASTQTAIDFEHTTSDGNTVRIAYNDESRGTQMWFSHIGPVLKALRDGSVLVIDELDASLHPLLSRELILLFSSPETNPHGAQLIFSTHDTSLLSSLLGDQSLAREEVWFTEKDNRGATVLYPLTDFHPRKTEALERGYLSGRYGAVPIVSFNELAETVNSTS